MVSDKILLKKTVFLKEIRFCSVDIMKPEKYDGEIVEAISFIYLI